MFVVVRGHIERTCSSTEAGAARSTWFVGQAFLAIGDAAFSTDPIYGKGVLYALQQGHRAACAIVDYLNGSQHALSEFADSLEGEFANYVRGLHGRYQQEGRWQ